MDVVECLKSFNEMCDSYESCEDCELNTMCPPFMSCTQLLTENPEKIVPIIERWSKGLPKKTRQDKILEVFPNARKDDDGVIMVCPYYIGVINNCGVDCSNCWECREKYWLEEVEE